MGNITENKMTITASVEINFYRQDEASVFFENSATGPDEQLAEMLMFCGFALRQMYNLGKHPITFKLADLLCNIGPHAKDVAITDPAEGPRLVDYKGHPGRKRFLAKLEFDNSIMKKFRASAKGFGVLARGVGYYAPAAVMVLFKYFATKRKNDEEYLSKLGLAAVGCGTCTQRPDFLNSYLKTGNVLSSLVATQALYSDIDADEKDTQSLEDIHIAAEQGDALAQFNLGVRYANGEGVAQDKAEATKWYLKAAEQGFALAQHNLGVCYENGEGVARDMLRAVKWYRKAAENGYAPAQYNLGIFCATGKGVAQDKSEAIKWFRKAAEQDFAQAQYNLGTCYDTGEGVGKDMSEAVKWYRMAAEKGYAEAQYNLAVCYATGEGVVENRSEAMKWFSKAAEQGYVEAQKVLGWHEANGEGT